MPFVFLSHFEKNQGFEKIDIVNSSLSRLLYEEKDKNRNAEKNMYRTFMSFIKPSNFDMNVMTKDKQYKFHVTRV